MSEHLDFERAWLAKLDRSLSELAGDDVRQQVMAGSESLSMQSERRPVIDWTAQAMQRLDALVEPVTAQAVLTGCACHTSHESLQAARDCYQATGDVDQVLAILQAQFENFLRTTLQLEERYVQQVVERGWGMAGVRRGNAIIATKIPKSGYLLAYLQADDPQRRRQLYCHCPRVRDALALNADLPPTYCYCGAGFYQDIWQTILGRPVRVELLASVLQGDEVCQVAIHLS